VARPFTTWRDYDTQVWEIELIDYDGNGTVDVEDARFVLNNNRYRAVNVEEFAGEDASRTFNGLQIVLTKRYSNRLQGLFSVNFNQTDGIARASSTRTGTSTDRWSWTRHSAAP